MNKSAICLTGLSTNSTRKHYNIALCIMQSLDIFFTYNIHFIQFQSIQDKVIHSNMYVCVKNNNIFHRMYDIFEWCGSNIDQFELEYRISEVALWIASSCTMLCLMQRHQSSDKDGADEVSCWININSVDIHLIRDRRCKWTRKNWCCVCITLWKYDRILTSRNMVIQWWVMGCLRYLFVFQKEIFPRDNPIPIIQW